jgi:restriction system protein
MLQLLELLAGREQARRADLLPEWQAFLHQLQIRLPQLRQNHLYARLYNLIERDLVALKG